MNEDRQDAFAAALSHAVRGATWLFQRARLLLHQNARFARLMRLDRPIGIWLLLWPTLWALWLAGEGHPDQRVFAIFVIGTIVMRSAGCIMNDLADRRIDPGVRRTAERPLATGEVTVPEAVILFVGLMLIALGLVMSLNRLSLWLALGGAAVTVIYPFLKRFFELPQLGLGIAFAWGVPMAYAAELGSVPRIGWLVFLVTMIWGVMYDTEYAMADRDDDLKIGVNSSAILFGEMDRAVVAGLQLMFLAGFALVALNAGLGRWFFIGLALALVLCLRQLSLIRDRIPADCVRAFQNNAWLGGTVFAGIVLDYIFRGV